MELDGRSALVTGGAGGLGGATVRHLVGIGLGVAIFDRDTERATAWPTTWATRPSPSAAT